MAQSAPVMRTDSLPPEAISPELAPTIAELGLEKNCRELTFQGWTVVENVSSPEFNGRLQQAMLDTAGSVAPGEPTGAPMLLAKDPVFAEAVLNPYLLAIAEFRSAAATCGADEFGDAARLQGPQVARRPELDACTVSGAQHDPHVLLGDERIFQGWRVDLGDSRLSCAQTPP